MAQSIALPDGMYQLLADDARRQGLSAEELATRILGRHYPISGALSGWAPRQNAPADVEMDSYRATLPADEFAFLEDFTTECVVRADLDPVELVRSHDD